MSISEQRYRDLQNLARATGRSMQELLTIYILEGFLSRVAESSMKQKLVLKGGVLLAAFDARRPTRDIDFSAMNTNNDSEYALTVCSDIASILQEDGIVFDVTAASAETIRDDDEYSGARVSLFANLHTARISFHIDLNVGDPIVPGAQEIGVPRMLEVTNPIVLLGYPMSMVLAEKLVTAMQRGTGNTRWRDFGDIYQLSRTHPISFQDLEISMRAVAEYRAVDISPLQITLAGYAEIGQTKYENWRRKQARFELPKDFGELLAAVFAFSDPFLEASSSKGTSWDPLVMSWK